MSGQGAPSLQRYPSTADTAPPTPATDTRNIKRSRQDDLALLGMLRADARLPNRAERIRALSTRSMSRPCRPILPASPRRLRSMAPAEQPS